MRGFFDLQINGYVGVDFNSANLNIDDLHRACLHLQQDGVDGILLTLITDAIPSLQSKIRRIVEMCRQDAVIQKMVRGLHIEGPFLSPVTGYIGAHPAVHAQKTDLAGMDLLLEAGEGLIKLVTLAPEMDQNQQLTRSLADAGIIVAAGHTNASLDELQAGIDAGLTMFTHLANGCPREMDRHDNIINRVLSLADQLWISFIADGAHIPFFVLGNYLKITGLEKVVIVTDAIAAAGMNPGLYTIGGCEVYVGEDGVPRAPGGTNFVGSGTKLLRMATNLRDELLLTQAQVDLITKENPRKLMKTAIDSVLN
ncbi:N-acetylglucosamine-6-phosphate deacetylase [Planctomicrobium sp. SH661]|uniref:N-acetylglucosamine-6-phosphate deacetylase n=1 Tax=Planctomicrobium sp. SH661 TaxID=3448124 RepID=UPI003F5C4D83